MTKGDTATAAQDLASAAVVPTTAAFRGEHGTYRVVSKTGEDRAARTAAGAAAAMGRAGDPDKE
jgi:hypothetical protein